ncbi:MAG: acetolactate synthase large subunit [Pseudomonadota bacterium]
MNGAEGLIQTLANAGVDVCFANPGTSEMQLVAALDGAVKMRAILGLFEGVVTGAADGYGRMAGKPALTLLHLGPGLGNGLANLHNAKRARSPIINLVGDHATDHLVHDAPLTSDLDGVAAPMSDWVRRSRSAADLASAGASALQAAMRYPGAIATIIAPADHAWDDGGQIVAVDPIAKPEFSADPAQAATALRAASQPVLFLGGPALSEKALRLAGTIAAATGARLITETFCARLQRGVGRVVTERLPYFAEAATEFLAGTDVMVCIGAAPPVAFFAYPGKPSTLWPPSASVIEFASARDDCPQALAALASSLNAGQSTVTTQQRQTHDVPPGTLDAKRIGFSLANHLPANAIVSDEAATAGLAMYNITASAEPHDWLMLTGGSIGQGLPVAIGASVACPDRKVIALQADGGALYTVQSLWTMARERLDITVIIINNASYAILNIELARVGVSQPGEKALSLLDLGNPDINWCDLARGFGLPAVRVDTAEAFDAALETAMSESGPRLIEAVIAPAHKR